MSDTPRIEFKDGSVNPFGIHPRIKSALYLTADIYHQTAAKPLIITSLCDGVHGSNSYHYLLGAFDGRTKHLEVDEKEGVTERLRRKLGDQWDVLLEDVGEPNEHLHVEVNIREQLKARIRGEQKKLAREWNEQLQGGSG